MQRSGKDDIHDLVFGEVLAEPVPSGVADAAILVQLVGGHQ